MAKEKIVKVKTKAVVFSFHAPDATQVSVAGDFNNWDFNKHPMKKDKEGKWKKTIKLSPGDYGYKYYVDGDWCNDPDNNEVGGNSFGTYNNIVKVTES